MEKLILDYIPAFPGVPISESWVLMLLCWSLFVVGFKISTEIFLRNLRFIYTQYFRCPKDLIARYGAGSWCVVTGIYRTSELLL